MSSPKHVRPAHWRRLGPGVYVDESTSPPDLHVDIPELLQANGYADTPENRELMTQAARELCAAEWPDTVIQVRE